MSRRLVITADDLGRERGTNEVIAALLAEGHVTATTLIPVAPGAEEAANRLRELGVVPHLHVTLTSERALPPWRPLSDGPSLVDPNGALTDDPFVLGARGETDDVVAEMEAQLAWMRDHGINPAAADSHAGTLYGLHGRSWLAEALQWCHRHGFAFRLPRDPEPYWGGPLPPPFASAHERAIALADSLGVPLPETIVTNRRFASDLGSYEGLRSHYLGILAAMPEGTSELLLHPSTEDAVAAPFGIDRAWEARLLRDPVWHRAIETEGFELVRRWW
jgi:chitin disaccharide deacetylase